MRVRATGIWKQASRAKHPAIFQEQHRGKRDRGCPEIDAADAPHADQRTDIDQSVNRGKDNGGQHGLGKMRQQSRKEEQAHCEGDRAYDQRKRCAGARGIIHRGLRQSTRCRIAIAERYREVGGAQTQKFLSYVQTIPMLRRKASRRRDALDVSEQQATRRQGKQLIHFHRAERRHMEGWQPLRNFSGDRDAPRWKAEHGCGEDRQTDHA